MNPQDEKRPRLWHSLQNSTGTWIFPKIGVPKMDGENNGSKPYEQMDDLGVPLFLEKPTLYLLSESVRVWLLTTRTKLKTKLLFPMI